MDYTKLAPTALELHVPGDGRPREGPNATLVVEESQHEVIGHEGTQATLQIRKMQSEVIATTLTASDLFLLT